jgi:hypothetical protein
LSFSNITSQNLGTLLYIVFSEGVRSQLSQDYREFEYMKQQRVSDPNGREHRFQFQRSYGPAAIQYRNPNFTSAFPTAQQISISENTAVFKEINGTIEIEQNMWKRAMMSPAKYAEPLALEIQSKNIASKRRLAADFWGEGLGVVGTASTVTDTTGANGYATVVLNTSDTAKGFVGFFEFGDLLLAKTQAGAAQTAPTVTGTFYAWRVKARTRKTDTVQLEAVDSSGTVLALTASNIAATNVFYRVGQPTIPDLTASIADYGTATEVIPGLEALIRADGGVCHGITLSGASAGTVLDWSGNPIDVSAVQEGMDTVKVNVGQGVYNWKMLAMAPETHSSFIESRETDRRFQTVEDNKRGVKFFAYVHGNDVLECYTSEFCPKKRVYALPEAKAGQKVLESHMTDFTSVSAKGGDEFMLKPASGGGHERRIVSYLEAYGTFLCKHPAAVLQIRNFTV